MIFKFLLSGGAAALANVISRIIFDLYLSYEISVVLAFLIGLITGFILMKTHVFKTQNTSILVEFLKYVAVNMIALTMTLTISILGLEVLLKLAVHLDNAKLLAHISGVIVPVYLSYIFHKNFTFQHVNETKD